MSDPSVRLAAVSPVYPSPSQPTSGTFVRSLIHAMHRVGAEVRVLAPESRSRALVARLRDREVEPGTDQVTVRRPRYWSVSARLVPWGHWGERLSLNQFRRAVDRGLPEVMEQAEFVYCHFFSAGWASANRCLRSGVPRLVALGESNLRHYTSLVGSEVLDRTLAEFEGIIAVSEANADFCRRRGANVSDRILVLPNAVDTNVFRPTDRADARRRVGVPPEAKIVVFAGHFIERKGPLRVLRAVERLEGVSTIFLGDGPQWPRGSRVLHTGPRGHAEMPLWLAAADCFVLPSVTEGMSNAILEALACGLPVVVADRPFNHEFLTDDCAAFVQPDSEQSIAEGIDRVLDTTTKATMATNARRVAERHSLSERARRVLAFGRRLAGGSDVEV